MLMFLVITLMYTSSINSGSAKAGVDNSEEVINWKDDCPPCICECEKEKLKPVKKIEKKKVCKIGLASYYGPYDPYSGVTFHGRRTANGEIYDMNKLTAAHKTLPFNTIVHVERKERDEDIIETHEVEVRINDRGPYYGGRIIDLSYKAAKELNMIGVGVAQVKICWEKK